MTLICCPTFTFIFPLVLILFPVSIYGLQYTDPPAECTHPLLPRAYELDTRNLTATNSSNGLTVDYHFPKCPVANFSLSKIFFAQVSYAAITLDATLVLSASLYSCQQSDLPLCPSVNISVSNLVPAGVASGSTIIIIDMIVYYTCEFNASSWNPPPSSLFPSSTQYRNSSSSVTYIRLELTSVNQDWNCTFTTGAAGTPVSVTWFHRNDACDGANDDNSRLLECAHVETGTGNDYNDTSVSSLVAGVVSTFCMASSWSVGRMKFFTDVNCASADDDIFIDIQVDPESGFGIQCSSQDPDNYYNDASNQINSMKTDCSQMTSVVMTTTMMTSSLLSPPPPATSSPSLSSSSPSRAVNFDLALGLGLGLGLGFVVLLVLIIIIVVLAVIIRSRRKKRKISNKEQEMTCSSYGNTMTSDIVFCQASGIPPATNANRSMETSTDPPERVWNIPKINNNSNNNNNNNNNSNNNNIASSSSSSPNNDSNPATRKTTKPKRRNEKTTSSLSRRLFSKIARIARQELEVEKGKEKEKGKEGEVDESRVNESSESSLVDRWMYSSTLSGMSGNNNNATDNSKKVNAAELFVYI